MIEEFTNFKIDILCELDQLRGATNKMKDLQDALVKKETHESIKAVYCPRCRKKHALHECLFNKTQICSLCIGTHLTDECELLPIVQMTIHSPLVDLNYAGPRVNYNPFGYQNQGYERPPVQQW